MSILLIFKTNLHSDLLFLDSLMADLFRHGGAWSDWKLTPAPAFVPDMLAYAIGYFIFPTPAQRVTFVCVVQALLLAWSSLRFACVVKPALSTEAKVFILLLISAVVLVAANSSMWLFYNSTNNHFAALFFPLLGLAGVIEFLKKRTLAKALLILACVALGTASTSVFILAFTLPALILCIGCLVIFRSHRAWRWSAIQIAVLLVAGHLLATIANGFLIAHDSLTGRAPLTIDYALRSVNAFIAASEVTFARDNIYTFSLVVFVVLASAWVLLDWLLRLAPSFETTPGAAPGLWLKISDDNWAHRLSVVFLLLAFPVDVLGSVLSGGFVDNYGYRYFAFPIVLGVLLWVVLLDSRSVFQRRWSGPAVLALFAALAVLGVTTSKRLLAQSGRTSYAEALRKGTWGPGEPIGACLDREAEKGFVFGAGIGDFWNARAVTYTTAKPMYILPVTNDAMPFFHMMSLGPLMVPHRYGFDTYNVAIVRRSGTHAQFDVTPETIGRHLPHPTKIVSCENTDAELWLYANLELDAAIKARSDFFLTKEGLQRNIQADARDLPGETGSIQGLSRVADAAGGKTGYLSYGPYVTVPAGRYQVTLTYTATEAGNRWDAGRFKDPKHPIRLARAELPVGHGEITFLFETGKTIPDFEIRTWFGGRGSFTLDKVQLHPAASPALVRAQQARWVH